MTKKSTISVACDINMIDSYLRLKFTKKKVRKTRWAVEPLVALKHEIRRLERLCQEYFDSSASKDERSCRMMLNFP